jgi:hypothetical protein
MSDEQQASGHSAEAAALGFYYQTFYALLTLLQTDADDAAVIVEQLDDVELLANGQKLLFQLKHSLSAAPAPVSIKSPSFWSAIRVWIDALPLVSLAETHFHLVTVAPIAASSPLIALTSLQAPKDQLRKELCEEAQRVASRRAEAVAGKKALPFADRADACEAFLGLSETEQLNLLRRATIRQNSASIVNMEGEVVAQLHLFPPEQRESIASRLIEWWDRQVVYSLCDKRDRAITRTELQYQLSVIVAEIEQEKLIPDFELMSAPREYQPDGMLARQILLVDGKESDFSKAIREEWRAREQRHKWANERPGMAVTIAEYDRLLVEHWEDRHSQMVEGCVHSNSSEKCSRGLELLRWTHDDAPHRIRPIADSWSAPYYVRGSYQVLAINLHVGWHADFAALLGGEK